MTAPPPPVSVSSINLTTGNNVSLSDIVGAALAQSEASGEGDEAEPLSGWQK